MYRSIEAKCRPLVIQATLIQSLQSDVKIQFVAVLQKSHRFPLSIQIEIQFYIGTVVATYACVPRRFSFFSCFGLR